MLELVGSIDAIGLDLEYAIRAWCVLERCYLPKSEHSDVRVLRLLPLLEDLKHTAFMIVAKKQVESALQVVNIIEQLNGLLSLCQPSEESKKYYQNAFSLHYLKKRVLTITNPNDYKYLDRLLVTDSDLGDYGALYLQAAADAVEMRSGHPWMDSSMYFPPQSVPEVSLFDFVCDRKLLKQGAVVSKLRGAIMLKIVEYDKDDRRMLIRISDAGVCAAAPHIMDVEVEWKGSREAVKRLKIRKQLERDWTKEERVAHKKFVDQHQDRVTEEEMRRTDPAMAYMLFGKK